MLSSSTNMVLFQQALFVVLLHQTACNAAADDAAAPVRRRTQKRHSSNVSANLRGGSMLVDVDEFDPFIGVQRELEVDDVIVHSSMSLSMPIAHAPLLFIQETDAPRDAPASSSPTTSVPATLKPTLYPTSVLPFSEGSFLVGGGLLMEERTETMPPTTKPTLYPTSVL